MITTSAAIARIAANSAAVIVNGSVFAAMRSAPQNMAAPEETSSP